MTAWSTVSWSTVASVRMRGSVKYVSFHLDGKNVMLGPFRAGEPRGKIRNRCIGDTELSIYNMLSSAAFNGLAFRNNGNDVIVGSELGVLRIWIGPTSLPILDFEADYKSRIIDLSLSACGSRVAPIGHDAMIGLWSTDTGTVIASYAPVPVAQLSTRMGKQLPRRLQMALSDFGTQRCRLVIQIFRSKPAIVMSGEFHLVQREVLCLCVWEMKF